jgi:ABC-2 type transport system permease protein
MKTLKDIYTYTKVSIRMDAKRITAYPASFWLVFFTIPFFSVVQIAFVESIYGQTSSFAGYTKYEAYLMFGTFRIVQGLLFLLFYNRLSDLKLLIRGEGEETFDSVLIKPIDSQLYATFGRYNLGNISSLVVGMLIVIYAVTKGSIELHFFNFVVYILLMMLGVFAMYLIFLIMSTFHFWFTISESAEDIWSSSQSFGQYPPNLYKGAVGVIFNILIPVTLMAGVPVNILLGKVSFSIFLFYFAVVAILFYISRQFWKFAVKQYSSSSS